MLGSKFCKATAAPGGIEKSSLSKIRPPPKETVIGDIEEVSGINSYPVTFSSSSINNDTVRSSAAEACALKISPASNIILVSANCL